MKSNKKHAKLSVSRENIQKLPKIEVFGIFPPNSKNIKIKIKRKRKESYIFIAYIIFDYTCCIPVHVISLYNVHVVSLYIMYPCTCCIPVHVISLYMLHPCTCCIPVHVVSLYMFHPCTCCIPVQCISDVLNMCWPAGSLHVRGC